MVNIVWIIDRHFLKSQLFDLSTDEPIYDRNCWTTKKPKKTRNVAILNAFIYIYCLLTIRRSRSRFHSRTGIACAVKIADKIKIKEYCFWPLKRSCPWRFSNETACVYTYSLRCKANEKLESFRNRRPVEHERELTIHKLLSTARQKNKQTNKHLKFFINQNLVKYT